MVIDFADVSTSLPDWPPAVCIVGAGTAGLPLALDLGRRGIRVLLLEAGDARVVPRDEPGAAPGHPYRGLSSGWIKSVGGTSRVWGGRLAAFTAQDLTAYGDDTPVIPYADLARYVGRVEELFGIPPGTLTAPPSARPTIDFGAPEASGVAIRHPVIATHAKRDLSRLLADIRQHPMVMLAMNAPVTGFKIDYETDRLSGLTVARPDGSPVTVAALHYVLASGPIDATRLMLILERDLGASRARPARQLGQNLGDHIAFNAGLVVRSDPDTVRTLLGTQWGRPRRAVHFCMELAGADRPAVQAYLNLQIAPRDPAGHQRIRMASIGGGSSRIGRIGRILVRPSDLDTVTGLAMWSLLGPSYAKSSKFTCVAQIVIEQSPKACNRIVLARSTDRNGMPEIELDWSVSEEDLLSAAEARSRYSQYWAASPIQQRCEIVWSDTPFDRSLDFSDMYHPTGTIPMHDDEAIGAVDANLASHDMKNLSVLTTAVLPRAGGGNPTLTLLALSYRLAERLSHSLAAAVAPLPDLFPGAVLKRAT